KDSTEILGGYNPIEWKSNNDGNFGTTNDSFIFSFKSDDIKRHILSRVKNEKYAIYCYSHICLVFGYFDLYLVGSIGRCDNNYYEKQIRESTEYFSVEEYEVFQILN
ncbi:hypothetical protein RhiirA1_476104, partial [Rhizophagus irregularis]